MKWMLESMLKMDLYGFFWEAELLKCRCTVCIHAASLQGSLKGLAVPCSTLLSGCFQFSKFFSFPAKNQWLLASIYSDLVVMYFVKKILHVTCSTLMLIMYSWNVEMALQNFVPFCVYPCYAPWDLENWANRVALHDAALARWSNVGVHKGVSV